MIALHYYLLQAQRFASKQPRLVLGLVTAIFIGGAIMAPQLQYLTNIDDLASTDFQAFNEMETLKREFSDHNLLVFFLHPPEGRVPTVKELCHIKGWIQRTADSATDIISISSTFGVRNADWSEKTIQFLPMIDINCASTDPQTEKIKKGFEDIKNSAWAPIMANRKANDVSILFQLTDNAEDKRSGSFDSKIVDTLQKNLEQDFFTKYPDWKLVTSGNTSFLRYLKKAYDQTQLINGFLLVIVSLFFWFLFNSWKAGFLFIGSILCTLIPVYGGMAMAGTPIDLLTNSIPLMVTISCLEDYVFYLFLYQKTKDWRKSMRLLILPCFLTSFTTAIGFGSLYVSDLEMIRRFGAWSAFAGILEWTILFIGFPALFKAFPKLADLDLQKTPLQKKLEAFSRWQPKFRWSYIALLIIPASLLLANKIKISDIPEETFAKSHPVYQSSLWLTENRGWTGQVSLIFKNEDDNLNRGILTEVKKLDLVAGTEDKYTTLDFLTRNLPEDEQNITKRLWTDSPFSKRLISSQDTERALLYTKSSEINGMDAMKSEITKRICPNGECSLGGSLIIYAEFGLRIFKTLFESLSLSLILIGIIIYLSCRHTNTKQVWIFIATSWWGPLALLLIFTAFQIPIFYASSICVSILIGLSGDNAIQYLYQRGSNLKSAISELGPASVSITFGMNIMTLLFFFSDFAPLQKLGVIMISGYTLMLVGDLFLLKDLVKEKNEKPN